MRLIRGGLCNGVRVCVRSGDPNFAWVLPGVCLHVYGSSPASSQLMMMIREARTGAGLSIGAHHMRRFRLTNNFSFGQKTHPILAHARHPCDSAFDRGNFGGRPYGIISPTRDTSTIFSRFHTQSGYATAFIGRTTPEKQIQTLLQP